MSRALRHPLGTTYTALPGNSALQIMQFTLGNTPGKVDLTATFVVQASDPDLVEYTLLMAFVALASDFMEPVLPGPPATTH